MRTRTVILTGALLLASSGMAQAQQTAPSAPSPVAPKLGHIDFGVRADSLSGDEARYNRFRDLRDGLFVQRFTLQKETPTFFFKGEANNVGYKDQRFAASYESIGKLKAGFEWNQIPLFIGSSTRTLYTDRGNGVLEIDDSIQRAIQNATLVGTAARDAAINSALAGARQYDLRSRRDNATFNVVYTLNRDVDVKFSLKNSHRSGQNLESFLFGTSPGGSPSLELPIPVDDRSTDVRGSVEFANAKGLLSLGYTGTWYDNAVPSVQFDNPLRVDSISNGAAVGRAALWPSSTMFSVNANGSYKLAYRTRATAAISIGRQKQDEALLPPTANTALVAPPLMRNTADAKADVTMVSFGLNSRPTETVWLNAKYRLHDFANKTAHFAAPNIVGDMTVGTATWENEPASIKRQNLDLDASFSPITYLSFNVGYGREDTDRTWRIFEKTGEDMFRASIDSLGNQYVSVRLKYEYSKRVGSGFEEELLEEVGEQPETRHFDIADRKRNRVTTLLTVTPISWFALNGSVGTGKDDYYETGFGLRDSKNNTWSAGFDVLPMDTVSFGLNYGYEKFTAFQYSRTSNPLPNPFFNDPTRDWSIDSDDIVKTFTASLDLLKALPKTDIRVSYDLSDGKATYVYGGPALTNPSVFSTVPFRALAPVKNKLTDLRFDTQYFVRENLALGVAYWYEDYKVQDFALDGTAVNSLAPVSAANGLFASTIYSGYLYRPYTAHTGWLRMTYLW